MIYYKRYTGKLLSQKTAEQPSWVQWRHHSEGKTYCEECLMLEWLLVSGRKCSVLSTSSILPLHIRSDSLCCGFDEYNII